VNLKQENGITKRPDRVLLVDDFASERHFGIQILNFSQDESMTTKADVQGHKRRIEDLTKYELHGIYSLAGVGDWSRKEISKAYKISEKDVRIVFDNYFELLGTAENNLLVQEQLRQILSPQKKEEKPRKRHSHAR
jgi:hypothetical protein